MSEYKPFLEVIKQMQIGDIAECEDRGYSAMTRSEKGFYFYDEAIGEKSPVQMWDEYMTQSFKIRPRYVGWDEAEEAIRKGKTVEWHLTNYVVELCIFTRFDFLAKKVGADLNIMFNGKFTIQEGK